MQQQNLSAPQLVLAVCALAVAAQTVAAVITVQIGGATRLGSSLSRQRERYNCFWDCDLVGCQIARDDDECAYDCEKICRVRYDYAGRSDALSAAAAAAPPNSDLRPKTGAAEPAPESVAPAGSEPELVAGKCGAAVRLARAPTSCR